MYTFVCWCQVNTYKIQDIDLLVISPSSSVAKEQSLDSYLRTSSLYIRKGQSMKGCSQIQGFWQFVKTKWTLNWAVYHKVRNDQTFWCHLAYYKETPCNQTGEQI